MFRIPSSLRYIRGNSKQIYSSKGKVLIIGMYALFTKMLTSAFVVLFVCSSPRNRTCYILHVSLSTYWKECRTVLTAQRIFEFWNKCDIFRHSSCIKQRFCLERLPLRDQYLYFVFSSMQHPFHDMNKLTCFFAWTFARNS